MKTIPIQQGNDWVLKIMPHFIDGTPINPTLIDDLTIKRNDTEIIPEAISIEGNYICIEMLGVLALGKYSITILGSVGNRQVRDKRLDLFEIVEHGCGIPYGEYRSECIIIGSSDDELDEIKADLLAKQQAADAAKAAADAKKAEFEEKIEELDDIATETQATANKQEILTKIENTQPDLSSVAKEATLQGVSDKVGTFTDPTETVAHKLENLTFDKTDLAKEATTAKQGNDITATNTAIKALLQEVLLHFRSYNKSFNQSFS